MRKSKKGKNSYLYLVIMVGLLMAFASFLILFTCSISAVYSKVWRLPAVLSFLVLWLRIFSTSELLSKFLALVSSINSIAPVTGPVFGGIILKFTNWKEKFIALAILGVILIGLSIAFNEMPLCAAF
ncbi:MAG: hypothetical protein M0P13_04085 [Fibrobacteraceae bacterium]|nr:hypothetical protein [Fibrobacteraceae bacterium]